MFCCHVILLVSCSCFWRSAAIALMPRVYRLSALFVVGLLLSVVLASAAFASCLPLYCLQRLLNSCVLCVQEGRGGATSPALQ